MKSKYKIPWHVRQYVKTELMEYKDNKEKLEEVEEDTSTREILIVRKRIKQIEKVLESLNKEDREAAELIFIKHYSQQKAEIEKGLSKDAFFNIKAKVIYLTAREMERI